MNYSLRQQYLEAIGVQSWQLKSTPDDPKQDVLAEEALSYDVRASLGTDQILDNQDLAAIEQSESIPSLEFQTSSFESPNQTVSDEPANFQQTVPHISVEVEDLKSDLKSKDTSSVSLVANTVELISELDQSILKCKQCVNRQTRLNVLSGQGNSNASIFIISEAPTADEDRSGRYLNEQSASLLESMFHSIDSNNDYFYTGIIKCYSFSDFLFTESEVAQCEPFLFTQIKQSQPSVIVIFGAIQAQTILQSKKSFNELRGKIHHVTINETDYPVVVTYHPAYLLRNPLYKREALNDLIMIKKLCNE